MAIRCHFCMAGSATDGKFPFSTPRHRSQAVGPPAFALDNLHTYYDCQYTYSKTAAPPIVTHSAELAFDFSGMQIFCLVQIPISIQFDCCLNDAPTRTHSNGSHSSAYVHRRTFSGERPNASVRCVATFFSCACRFFRSFAFINSNARPVAAIELKAT